MTGHANQDQKFDIQAFIRLHLVLNDFHQIHLWPDYHSNYQVNLRIVSEFLNELVWNWIFFSWFQLENYYYYINLLANQFTASWSVIYFKTFYGEKSFEQFKPSCCQWISISIRWLEWVYCNHVFVKRS